MEAVLVPLGLFAMIALIVLYATWTASRERREAFRLVFGWPGSPLPWSVANPQALLWGLVLGALALADFLYLVLMGETLERWELFLLLVQGCLAAALLAYHLLTAGRRNWLLQLYERRFPAPVQRSEKN